MHTFYNISSIKAATNLSSADIIATGSLITAFFSLVVAFFSFVITIVQAYITRRHNKLSVRPLIEVNTIKRRNEPVSIFLINHGLGTAIINEVYFILDNKYYRICSHNEVDIFFDELNRHKQPDDLIEVSTVIPPSNLGPDSEMQLLSFCNSIDDEDKFSLYSKLVDRINIKVKYKCLYNEEYTSYRYES